MADKKTIISLFSDTIDKKKKIASLIQKLHNHQPQIDRDIEVLKITRNCIESQPANVSTTHNEDLFNSIEAQNKEANTLLGLVAGPADYIEVPYESTSGSITSTSFTTYVSTVEYSYKNDPEISMWTQDAFHSVTSHYDKYELSQRINQRLKIIQPDLSKLHDEAKKATASCPASLDYSGAASKQRTLLEEFKGEVLRPCPIRKPENQHYALIAKQIIRDNKLIRKKIRDQQFEYNKLHLRLTNIYKHDNHCTNTEIKSYLFRIELHINIITTNLDPVKSGFHFPGMK
jgi:hypothetical protein